MLEHCDFTTQHTVDGDDGRLRPDMVVRLPGGVGSSREMVELSALDIMPAVLAAPELRLPLPPVGSA